MGRNDRSSSDKEPTLNKRNQKPATYKAEFFYDSVGRRRKLQDSAMARIREEFADGVPTSLIASEWGVSVALVRTICYNTARKRDQDKIGE
ncbi:hypothetical protein SEA_CHRISTIAN_52 [Arthrobacter phage Christian]|uniref:Helix-turn-helix DNA-binding domain protein n=2 Tax=Korravirus drrobert TaxID=1982078 RepID=A0A222ZGB7_9CAUD|nr:hypothetical protein SEA_LUCY_51 [Arthrobacter phage Lucy]ASR83435.1 hypothetical protein SEA_CHRISTIAN_52 [Arthrobacter phage Christian]WNM67628.1 hypothetical protein SEA_MAKOTO_51 [Arthrobacter phage Makoto]